MPDLMMRTRCAAGGGGGDAVGAGVGAGWGAAWGAACGAACGFAWGLAWGGGADLSAARYTGTRIREWRHPDMQRHALRCKMTYVMHYESLKPQSHWSSAHARV